MDMNAALPVSPERQLRHLRARNHQLEKMLEKLQQELSDQSAFAKQITEAVEALDPMKPFEYKIPSGESNSPIHSVAMESDWHIGAKSTKGETEGFGKFDWETAIERAFYITQKEIDHIYTQRNSFKIDTLHVLSLGDFVSGDIHDELRRKNEFDLPVQAAKAGWLLAEILRLFAAHFKEVIVHEILADNHGRLTMKPMARGKSTNNMNFVIYQLVHAYLQAHANVRYHTAEASTMIANINQKRFLLEHGDNVNAWMGIPWYGIERASGREARRRMNMPTETHHFHYQAIGHWHTAGWIPSVLPILVNGSLTGTSEYDHQCGRHAEPAQCHFLVHPRHGVFDFTAFHGE